MPDKLANDPRGHSSQFVPEAIEIPVYPTDPGSHSKPRQAAAPCALEYIPDLQRVQVEAPDKAYCPAGHTAQREAPGDALEVPAEQAVQIEAPVELE